MKFNNINHQHHWQPLLQQAQALAARLPDMGITPDELTSYALDDLLGTAAFLKRKYAEREA